MSTATCRLQDTLCSTRTKHYHGRERPHVFARLAAPKTFRGVTPARVGTMNRAMCFVMRLVVGCQWFAVTSVIPRRYVQILHRSLEESSLKVRRLKKFFLEARIFCLGPFSDFLLISINRGQVFRVTAARPSKNRMTRIVTITRENISPSVSTFSCCVAIGI